MTRQRALDFRRERLRTLWERWPERARRDVLAIYARLITRAAQQQRPALPRGGDR